jgi:hypothetical protein
MNMYEMWEIQHRGRSGEEKKEESRIEVKIPLGVPISGVKTPYKKRGRPRKKPSD